MKIPAISLTNSLYYRNNKIDKRQVLSQDTLVSKEVSQIPVNYFSNITFGTSHFAKLRLIFSQGMPCMYSGVEMIDPKKIQRMQKNGVFTKSASEVIKAIEPLEKCLIDIEKRVYKIIKEYSIEYPDKDFQQILKGLVPVYKKRLRKKQNTIFKELTQVAHDLPEAYKYKFKLFMDETHDKLNDRPVAVPFSASEFKYKLTKIKMDIFKSGNVRGNKTVAKMLQECSNFASNTESSTIETQKTVINYLELIFRTSSISKYEPLKELLEVSKKRLNGEKILMPFGRKTFLYDLSNLLEDLHNKSLRNKLFEVAQQLPTSSENVSAYIMKFANEPSEKIVYRILWPNIASIEHIVPKSKGGADALYNFGGAGARENARRGNADFSEQIERCNNIKKNCQKYVNKLIQLANKGFFEKHNIEKDYIKQFKETIENESEGKIVLNISKLK